MSKMIDLTGQRFGRLIAIKRSTESGTNKGVYWLCHCDCGKEKYIRGADLRDGSVKSCGCLKDEKTSKRFRKHGQSNTLLYDIWSSMKGRCFRKTCKDYPNYGGRGITVCNEWKNDFQAFYDWAISHGYKDHLTIERMNPNGNYEPQNCTWLENEKQAINRRNTKLIEYHGGLFNERELSKMLNINYNTLRDYIQRGKTICEITKQFCNNSEVAS